MRTLSFAHPSGRSRLDRRQLPAAAWPIWPWRCCCSRCWRSARATGRCSRLAPQRFRKEIGVMTGLIGAMAGGIGGFYHGFDPGHGQEDASGSYQPGFIGFALLALFAFFALHGLVRPLCAPLLARPCSGDAAAVRV
ncbi:hypothetical protein ACRAWD_15390 [Caulobacter segnis]